MIAQIVRDRQPRHMRNPPSIFTAHAPFADPSCLLQNALKTITLVKLVTCAALLGGCASSTPIQRYGESKSKFRTAPVLMSNTYPQSSIYRVFQQGSTGFTSIETLREDVEARATTFCERQGKGMIVLGERISPPPYILGNFPRIEIVFAAIDKPQTR